MNNLSRTERQEVSTKYFCNPVMLTTHHQSLSSVEEYILTVLDGNELYGLDILAAIASGTGGRLQLSAGTLYPTLRRLEKEERVESRWGDQEEGCGGARRKYYRLTPKGAAALGEAQKIRAGLVAWARERNGCFR